MKDLDLVKLKSEENDDLKDLNNLEYSRKNLFPKKLLNKFPKINIAHLINIFILSSAILINIYGLFNYFYSLKGCKNSRAYCLKYYSMKRVNEIIIYVLKAGISYSIIFVLAFWSLISFSAFSLVTSSYLALYIFDNDDNFANHGYYNFYGFFFVSLISIPILLYITYIIKISII